MSKNNTSQYYQAVETNAIFRVWNKSEYELVVFERKSNQYFDGLWEFETVEVKLGTFKTLDECFTAILAIK